MIKALLAHEAKCRENLKAFESKIGEAVSEAKGLPVGGGKDDRIERLVEEAKKDGDLDKIVSVNLRNKRKEELMSMEKPTIVQLCEKTGVDATVKDVMVERILAQESEGGAVIAMSNAEAPPAKKARVSKK